MNEMATGALQGATPSPKGPTPTVFLSGLSTQAPAGVPGQSLGDVILMLLLIVVIIVAAYFITRFIGAKSMRRVRGIPGHRIQLVDSLMLAKDKSVMLIKLNDQYFLIGVSPNNINLISGGDGIKVDVPGTAGSTGASDAEPGAFSQKLSDSIKNLWGNRNTASAAEDEKTWQNKDETEDDFLRQMETGLDKRRRRFESYRDDNNGDEP